MASSTNPRFHRNRAEKALMAARTELANRAAATKEQWLQHLQLKAVEPPNKK